MRNDKEKENQQKLKRTSPRRAKKDPCEAPVFLKKCFQMINEAPAEIACWSDSGDSFLVKDTDAFSELLPRFYKHKNFTSFVRQLNFYGFRKLRADDASSITDPHWWGFRHEKFRRGQYELLKFIKRSSHFETTEQDSAATEQLKSEVSRLRDRVDKLQSTIEKLTTVTNALLSEKQSDTHAGKKRRFDCSPDLHAHPTEATSYAEETKTFSEFDDEMFDSLSTFSFDESHTRELLSQLSIENDDITNFDLPEDPFECSSPANHKVVIGEDVCVKDEVKVKEELKVDERILLPLTPSSAMQVPLPDVAPYLAAAALGAAITQLASSEAAMLPNRELTRSNSTSIVA